MKLKRVLLAMAMMTFMVFALSATADRTYAYWASNIAPPSSVDGTATITTGTWNFISQWDPNETYYLGDRVVNNGDIYEAKRDFPGREPGVARGWNRDWFYIGPA
jgi:hypothetical protein